MPERNIINTTEVPEVVQYAGSVERHQSKIQSITLRLRGTILMQISKTGVKPNAFLGKCPETWGRKLGVTLSLMLSDGAASLRGVWTVRTGFLGFVQPNLHRYTPVAPPVLNNPMH